MSDRSLTADNPVITVPSGEMAAPGDYTIIPVQLEINGQFKSLNLIRQNFSGNCAEYMALNTAIIAQAAGMAINPGVAEYLAQNPNLNLDNLETEFIVPFILNAQETHSEQEFPVADVTNLESKNDNPYEPLTNGNAMVLLRDSVSPIKIRFEKADRIADETEVQFITSDYLAVVFIGTSNHASSIIKLGDRYLHVDPFYNLEVVRPISEKEAMELVTAAIVQPGSLVLLNPLCTK